MWKRLDVVFTLKSPLHIGYLPFKGSIISPTRYYVPGRNFWGAITRRTTEMLLDNYTPNDYYSIGKQVMDNFRISYFYLYDDENVFIPKYTNKGLIFGNEKEIYKSEFERRFIESRVITAIDKNSRTAEDASLHEIEFIKNKYKDDEKLVKNTKIIGCIWIKKDSKINEYEIKSNYDGIFVNNLNIIKELTLGGEQGYGFGVVKLEKILNEKRFSIKDDPNNENIKIILNKNEYIPCHVRYHKGVYFQGDIEILMGRGYFDIEKNMKSSNGYKVDAGRALSKPDYYFSPGTKIELKDKLELILNWSGTVEISNSNIS